MQAAKDDDSDPLDPRRLALTQFAAPGGGIQRVLTAHSGAPSGSERQERPLNDRKTPEAGPVSELHGIARFKIHEGKLAEFKRLSAQCMEIVRTQDTGTLQYDIYFNDDQSECIVYERYRDSDALIEHTGHLGDLMGEILATGTVSGELLGEPSADLRAKLADSQVRLFTPFLSM